jgi:hypothetical protein
MSSWEHRRPVPPHLVEAWKQPWARYEPRPYDPAEPVTVTSLPMARLSLAAVDAEIKRLREEDPQMYYKGDYDALLEKRSDVVRQMEALS